MIKKKKLLTVQICYDLQNHPTFNSEEMLANSLRGRECFVGLSLLLSYGVSSVQYSTHEVGAQHGSRS